MSAIKGRALEKEYRLGRNNVVRALDGADVVIDARVDQLSIHHDRSITLGGQS